MLDKEVFVMAAPPLEWKEGEGHDIHLLRGGPASKKLIDALDIDATQGSSVVFITKLASGSDRHGVEVNSDEGIVSALPHPDPPHPDDPPFPKVSNFILLAVFSQPSGATFETEIRVHIHDSVKDLFLTPSTLTIHKDTNECRFTVLARFHDDTDEDISEVINNDTIGDITDWPELTYQSADPSVATVLPGGVLKAEVTSGSAPITVNLTLPSLGINKTSAPAQALAKPSWADVARAAKVSFVAGKVAPNQADPESDRQDSVKSVVENAANVLFIADGFRNDQRFDYRNIVNTITAVMRGDEMAYAPAFQPFNILKNSINYWTVFVPSEQDGITLLGEYASGVAHGRLKGERWEAEQRPDPAKAHWSVSELIHEVGFPTPADAARTIAKLVADWRMIFGNHVTEERVKVTYEGNRKTLPFHSPLNERDTAFGLTVGYRRRASETKGDARELQLSSPSTGVRRTSVASMQKFVENLTLAGHPIGSTWKAGGKDFGLVCFICLNELAVGNAWGDDGYVAVSTGQESDVVNLEKTADSRLDVVTGPVIDTYRHLLASVVAHELSHNLGLGDEYGDGKGASFTDGADDYPQDPNLQAKIAMVSVAAGPPPYNAAKIKWLWPRIKKAGVLTRKLLPADITSDGIHVPLLRRHGLTFAVGDVVRFKAWPVSRNLLIDQLQNKFFRVKTREEGSVTILPVTVAAGTNDVTDVPMSGFDSAPFLNLFWDDKKYSLIQPLRVAGNEIKLVADSILKHIEAKDGPLNADPGNPTAACVAAGDIASIMTPRNLPALSRTPRTKADIIGIYEGGFYRDCGVFRPAGRCRMRDSDITTIPFCHVCRYIIVDTVDPSRHGDLDLLYPEVSP
jgi:hypothetical protein